MISVQTICKAYTAPMPQAIKNKDLQFAHELAKHTNRWIALKVKEKRIVASGKTLREVQKQIQNTEEKDYVFHLVPSKPLAMHEMSIYLAMAS